MPRISIITPTYNRAYLIPRMIKSVLNQTLTSWELIIVDDGSTDNTESVIENQEDSRIKYYYKENSGATSSRNFGVKMSTGEYIIFLDSDDEAEPHWLEEMNKGIIAGYAIICCGLQKYDYNGKMVGKPNMPENMGPFFNNTVANYLSGTLLMKKELFIKAGGYDIELTSGQHTELFIRLLKVFEEKKLDIKNIFKVLIKIHLHKGARVRNDFGAIYQGSTRVMKKHEELFLKHRIKHYNYLSVAGVCAVRIKKYDEGKDLLIKALKRNPYDPKAYYRVFVSYIPLFRDKIWKLK